LILLACTNPARQEARSLVEAVDRYRKAENPEKPPLADALEKVSCSDDEVCAAKDACTKTATPMAKALRKQRDAEIAILQVADGAIPKTDPRATALPGELDEVDRLIKESQDALASCDEKITALRVKSR